MKRGSKTVRKALILGATQRCSSCTSEAEKLLETGVMITACNSVSFVLPILSPSLLPLTNQDLPVNYAVILGGELGLLGGLTETPLTPP